MTKENNKTGIQVNIKKFNRIIVISTICILFPSLTIAVENEKTIEKEEIKLTFEQEVINLVEDAITPLPEKLKALKPQVRTIAIYSVFVDKEQFTYLLLKQLQSKIESALIKGGMPVLIFVPELKPTKIIAREGKFVLTSGIRSREEMLEISKKNSLDGFMEIDLLYSQGSLYLSLRITEISTGAIVWSETFSAGVPRSIAKKKKFIDTDFGVGVYSIELAKVKSGTKSLSVPNSAGHYLFEIAFSESQPPQVKKNIRYSFRIGGLLNNTVINSSETTFISGSSYVLTALYFKGGVIFPLIESLYDRSRNPLDFTLNAGAISGFGTEDLIVLSIGLETAITNHFSFAGEFNYIPATETELSGSTIRMGSSSFQFMILKYRF